MAKRIKVDIPRVDAISYIREGLRREGLLAPDDDAEFVVNADAVNDDDVLVEVAGVSVAAPERPKGVSLAELRGRRGSEEAAPRRRTDEPPARRPRRDDEERPFVHDEDEEGMEKEVRNFNRGFPAAPEKGPKAADAAERRARVGTTLEEMGKDPTDMSDEIGGAARPRR